MPRPPRPKAEHACWVASLALILSLAFAQSLRAATVITGDVTPALPWSAATFPRIGDTGAGTLGISSGSQLNSNIAYLGYNVGSVGAATITGAGSKWTSSSAINVGVAGSGELRVEAGGAISSTSGRLGSSPGSGGTATITGAGSKWTNTGGLVVGDSGSGELRVEAGGQVSNVVGRLGSNSGSLGTATITGAGSQWTSSYSLGVGEGGSGSLTVEHGGLVTAGTLYASLSDLRGDGTISAIGGAVLDADLKFNDAQPAQATFEFGAGGTLTVAAGGAVLGAGYKGLGNLTVSEGVAVSSSHGYLGYLPGSTGTATVTGAGSQWITNAYTAYSGYPGTSSFIVGLNGSSTLLVTAGGQIIADSGYLGFSAVSMGTATIAGPGSNWSNDASLYIGNYGSGALSVAAGGEVSNSSGQLGNQAGSKGTATVTGAGSKWTNRGDLGVGSNGTGVLTIANGGLVSVFGSLAIDSNGGNDSFVNLASGGMLALRGDADDSFAQFLALVAGTDSIRFWNTSLAGWTPLTSATLGVDYTLQYQTAGELTGYTLLTVLAPGPPGDFNGDGRVDGADFLAWQRGNSPTPNSAGDLATWRANLGLGAATPAATAVPEPGTLALAGVAWAGLLLSGRSTHGRER